MQKKIERAFLIVTVFLLLVPVGLSQTTNATLGGTAQDGTGALIPGVTITATNTQTGIVSTTLTNESGAYQFPSLQTGLYKVTAELPGFQAQSYSDVTLGVSQQVRLNFTLSVSSLTQTVEVSIQADTLLATSSSSVGTVLPEYKVRDLPLAARTVTGLVTTATGAQGSAFAGARFSQANTSRDGISVSDGRFQDSDGVGTTVFTSPDLVEEVRIVVAPADAESGRGVGQVQMVTRSGTNQFRGSLFWTNHNSALDANDFFSNFRGEEPGYVNTNQFGGRIGGPIVRNKAFFFVLYEGQRDVSRNYVTGRVLTAEARQGIFRYFPGAPNGNVLSNTPSVDRSGNPVREGVQSFSVFGKDPVRPGFDPTGWMQRLIARMPTPNNFEVGDGLNTAGYRWVRSAIGTHRDQLNVRLDYNFNANNKLSLIGTREHTWGSASQPEWPGGFAGERKAWPRVYSAMFVSTLSPTVVNEFRFGWRKGGAVSLGPNVNTKTGAEALATLPTSNGVPFLPGPQLLGQNIFNNGGGSSSYSPMFTYGDTVSFTKGAHAFKVGAEARFGRSLSRRAYSWLPRAAFGAGGVAVTGITAPGLQGADATLARNLLTDLAGSVASVSQVVDLRNTIHQEYRDPNQQDPRDIHQNEINFFFKDDWKFRSNLTINMGLRWDFVGAPWEGTGNFSAPVGLSKGLFGISGTGFADMYRPGHLAGSLMQVQPIGKNSINPDIQAWKDDWNNFGPTLGVSWSLPWWGADKTILRAGYGISSQGGGEFYLLDTIGSFLPGTRNSLNYTSASYLDLTRVSLPLPFGEPYATVPLTQRTQNTGFADENRVLPYVQNWNLEIQREVASNLTLEARYIGSKGTKLFGAIPLNTVNIFENGILDAFVTTRGGGNAPLFDQMLRGLNVTGAGVVNGTTLTGSQALRLNTNTRAFIANGDVGQLADFLNRSTNFTNEGGGILRNGGLPENFIVVNPQFNGVALHGNPANSTYHSMQLQLTKRLSYGFTGQGSYNWSRAIGEADTDDGMNYRDPRNRKLNKTLLGFHRTHAIKGNGTFELPFGPNRALLGNAPGWLSRIVEGWQLGGIMGWSSGAPLNITASTSTIHQMTSSVFNTNGDFPNTPTVVGDFPKSTGQVTRTSTPGVITYFPGTKQVTDPGISLVTAANGLQNQFSNYAIADSQGRLLLINPVPGQLGNLGKRWIEAPSRLSLDMNLLKQFSITETKSFEVRIDAINILNTPQWDDPVLDINDPSFGTINSASGNRTFWIGGRVNF